MHIPTRKNRRCKVGLQNTKTNLPEIERKKTVTPLITIYRVYPNPKYSVITRGETSRRHPDKNMFTRDRILPIARVWQECFMPKRTFISTKKKITEEWLHLQCRHTTPRSEGRAELQWSSALQQQTDIHKVPGSIPKTANKQACPECLEKSKWIYNTLSWSLLILTTRFLIWIRQRKILQLYAWIWSIIRKSRSTFLNCWSM